MQHVKLGGLDVARIGLGAMGMSHGYTDSGTDEAESIATLHRALELGVTVIDTAEIYGPYTNEELLGRALRGRWEQVVVATKFGMISHAGAGPWNLDSSPANIRTAVEGSLKRLGTDHIDLYYQHRVDPAVPIEEVAGAVADLIAEGKVGAFGLSEAGPDTIRRAHAVHPVAAVQSEYSLWTRGVEERVLPVLRELGIGLVPFAPLGHGFLTGQIRTDGAFAEGDFRHGNPRFTGDNLKANLRIANEVQAVAAEVGASAAQVAIAWLLAQGDDVVPIPGTKRVVRLEENTAATDLHLTQQQLARLSELPPAAGDTHAEAGLAMLER